MRLVVIGDIHGKLLWRSIIEKESSADKIIFIGDYFDSFENTGKEQIPNFQALMDLKRKDPEKYVFLIGNHDYHYLDVDEQYSGFQRGYQHMIRHVLQEAINEGLLQIAYQDGKYLFTHAGITKTWLKKNVEVGDDDLTVADVLNYLFRTSPKAFKFAPGKTYSNTGDDVTQGPLWVRPRSLKQDALEGVIHVVGHTRYDEIMIHPHAIFIDCLDREHEYLVIENGIARTEGFDEKRLQGNDGIIC